MSAEITETTADDAAEATMEVVEVAAPVEETGTDEVVAVEAVEVVEEPADETPEPIVASADAVSVQSLGEVKPKMKVNGTVKRVDLYGAIIDLGIDATALIHISKLGAEQINRVSDVLKVGDSLVAWVESVNPDRQPQIMLTLVEPLAVDWNDLKEGQIYTGKVTRLENYGAFVNIGAEREGLVHISELSHEYVKSPNEVISVGQEVTVKVLGFNRRKRRIDLSMKALVEQPAAATSSVSNGKGKGKGGRNNSPAYVPDPSDYEEADEEFEEMPTAMEIALRRALGNEGVSAIKIEQRGSKKQSKHSSDKRQMQQEVIDRILQMTSEN